jgi:hypothetical protein
MNLLQQIDKILENSIAKPYGLSLALIIHLYDDAFIPRSSGVRESHHQISAMASFYEENIIIHR